MIKLVDLSFNATPHILSVQEAYGLFKVSYGYADLLNEKAATEVILRLGKNEQAVIGNVCYTSVKAQQMLSLPRLLWYVRSRRPDVVIVNGLDFYRQTILLRRFLPSSCRIMVRHHGERYEGNDKAMRQQADKYVDAYLFTSFGNAKEWIEQGIINSQGKSFEVLEASTTMPYMDKQQARQTLNMPDQISFLWVGRLTANKDPLTVLKGFEQYLLQKPGAKLYIVYQNSELIDKVKACVDASSVLKDAVMMVGWVPNEPLRYWYNAADYYISGSHSEGSGYALIEAMACGCIPVVTNIPSFAKITDRGRYGFLYEKGDVMGLANVLMTLDEGAIPRLSVEVREHFESALSYQKIADDILDVCMKIQRR